MVKAAMDIRIKSVVLYQQGIKTAKEIGSLYGISERTLRRWNNAYRKYGAGGLEPKSTRPKRSGRATPKPLKEKILKLKQKYPSWGARRIKHQFGLPVSWRSVHSVIKKYGLLVRIRAKPQPCKRFARYHVDSLWQGDTFQFRIHDVGKVYVTGFTDDCSRYRIRSNAYLRKGKEEAVNALRWALRRAGSRGRSTWTMGSSSLQNFSRRKPPNTESSWSSASPAARGAGARLRSTTARFTGSWSAGSGSGRCLISAGSCGSSTGDTTVGGSRRRLAGRLRPAFTSIQSILTRNVQR